MRRLLALTITLALWAAAPAAGARPMPSPAPDPASAAHGPVRVSLAPPRAYGDFNQDGHTDVAVVLLCETPVGHEFAHLVALLGDSTGAGRATSLVSLGDGIALDDLAALEGRIAVTFRTPGRREIPITRTFTVQGNLLREE